MTILVEIVICRKHNPNMSILPYCSKSWYILNRLPFLKLCDSFVAFLNEIKHVLAYKRIVTNQIICGTGEAYGLSEV